MTRHEGYTKSADVFSYGMLLFELVAHEVPFADRPPLQAAVAIGLQDLRPPLPDGMPPSIATLIRHCWSRRPALRPKFDEVLSTVQHAHASLATEERVWLDAPHGHSVYGNAAAGAETAAVIVPPPQVSGQRPSARDLGMSAIIEAHAPPPPAEREKLAVSGT